MNQIPNIEEIKKILPCIDPQCDNQGTTITVNSDGEPEQMQCEYCYRERFPILDYFHQQLQKARQDWLREEIVRLDSMLIKEYMKGSPAQYQNKAILEVMKRYQAELARQPDQSLNQERE